MTERPGQAADSRIAISFAETLHAVCRSGLVLVDRRRQISLVTPRAEEVLALPSAHASWEALPTPLAGIAEQVLTSGAPALAREIDLVQGGKSTKRLRVDCFPLVSGCPRSGVAFLVEDLTHKAVFDRQLDQVDRLATLGTLAASMAHEIKNALVAGKTFIDLVLEKNAEAELADVVQRELARINAIVSRMLRFAAPTPGSFTAVHLHEVLDHSLRLLEPQLQGRSITLARAFQAAPDVVKGDEYQLQHLFLNLLLNGFEAMTGPGQLVVETGKTSPRPDDLRGGRAAAPEPVQVRIKDEGIGIPAENMGRLFEPFFTTKHNGTGLGLAIAQRIVHEHGGSIRADSEPGRGTTFTVVLPGFTEF